MKKEFSKLIFMYGILRNKNKSRNFQLPNFLRNLNIVKINNFMTLNIYIKKAKLIHFQQESTFLSNFSAILKWLDSLRTLHDLFEYARLPNIEDVIMNNISEKLLFFINHNFVQSLNLTFYLYEYTF